MTQGRVTKVDTARGFGFLGTTDRRSIFFHASDLVDGLVFDQKLWQRDLEFEIVEDTKGPRAVNVRPICIPSIPRPKGAMQ